MSLYDKANRLRDVAMDKKILNVIKSILNHPSSQVCKHWAALEVLKLIDESVLVQNIDFVRSIVDADDAKSLEIIEQWASC